MSLESVGISLSMPATEKFSSAGLKARAISWPCSSICAKSFWKASVIAIPRHLPPVRQHGQRPTRPPGRALHAHPRAGRCPCPERVRYVPGTRSSVRRVQFEVTGDLGLPAGAVVEKFRLVVEELLARLGGELEVRPLDDGIDRAGLLAEAAVDALGHVDVIARGAAAAVLARFGVDRDRLRRADRLTKLAGDAAFLAVRVAAERMFAAEAGGKRPLLVRVVERRFRRKEVFHAEAEALEEIDQEEVFRGAGVVDGTHCRTPCAVVAVFDPRSAHLTA